MGVSTLAAIKLQTADLAACESFFKTVFGFAVILRYGGGAGDPFEEIVMTLGGGDDLMLKFIQLKGQPGASGATLQIRLDDIDATISAAEAAGATVTMPPTDYPEAGVCMAVISALDLDIELVKPL